MKFKQIKNPRYSNAQHTQIDCDVEFARWPGQLMCFTASQNDVSSYGHIIYQRLVSGEFGVVANYPAAPESPPETAPVAVVNLPAVAPAVGLVQSVRRFVGL